MKPISWRRIGFTVSTAVVVMVLAYLVWVYLSRPRHVEITGRGTAPVVIRVSVKGTIRDISGKPIPYARVYLLYTRSPKGGMAWVDERIAGDKGQYLFSSINGFDATHPLHAQHVLLEPFYDIVAEKPGYGFGCIHIVPTKDCPSADIPLRSEHMISGTVRDENGMPLPGAAVGLRSVGLQDTSGTLQAVHFSSFSPYGGWWYGWEGGKPAPIPPPLGVFADRNGRFALSGLPSVDKVALEGSLPGYFPGSATGLSAAEDVTLVLKKALVLKGRLLVSGSEQPLGGTTVWLKRPNQSWPYVCSTDQQGYFAFDRLRDGSYELSVPWHEVTSRTVHLTRENSEQVVVIHAR